MEPLISVLIPTYNRPKELIRAVRSVISQTYSNIEIIVSDNSELDVISNLLDNINFNDRKIVYNFNYNNIGPILNWKRALELSNGEYCIFLPDDDYLINPFYFEDSIEIFKNNNIKLLFTACILGHSDRNNSIAGRKRSEVIRGVDFISGFWNEFNIPTFANLFHKSLAEKINPFNCNDILYSDIEFWLKSLAISDVYFYNTPSVYYSFHDSNIVKNMSKEVLVKNSIFISSVIDFYRDMNVDINCSLIKSSLITNYIGFTSSIYSFVSIKYMNQIFNINFFSFTNLNNKHFFNLSIKTIYRIVKKVLK